MSKDYEVREPRHWQVQEAKARFSAVLDAAEDEGPQIVTRRGVETAVIVPFAEWQRITRPKYRNVKEWLLAPEARTENLAPARLEWELRPAPKFD